jgi:hypothetical protein
VLLHRRQALRPRPDGRRVQCRVLAMHRMAHLEKGIIFEALTGGLDQSADFELHSKKKVDLFLEAIFLLRILANW